MLCYCGKYCIHFTSSMPRNKSEKMFLQGNGHLTRWVSTNLSWFLSVLLLGNSLCFVLRFRQPHPQDLLSYLDGDE